MARRVKVKGRCCTSRPRCKRCPVVLHRLEQAGIAERTGKRTYTLRGATKSTLRAATRAARAR